MSCCGKKRAEWLQETNPTLQHKLSNPADLRHEKKHGLSVFEYTGDHSLKLKGLYTGKEYHFRFPGDQVEVEYPDSSVMMARMDLKLIGKQKIEQIKND